MSSHVSIEQDEAGQTLACKRATDADGGPRVRAEADRLAAVEHPGVVRFVELRETIDGPTLVTEYVGPRTLATLGPVTTERAAALIADLASTVADLHALGIVHGALSADHVLVAGTRVVLCGFAADTDGQTPADDVLAVGLALRGLLDPELEEEPIPDRRPWRRVPWVGYRHRALLTLADQTTHDEPGRRPAARALADAIGEMAGAPMGVGSTVRPRPTGASRGQAIVDLVAVHLRHRQRSSRTRDRSGPPRRATLLGAGGLVVVALGALGASGQVSTPPETTAPAGITTAPRACPVAHGPLVADLDDDGCPNAVRIGPGWIEVDDRRYRVGRPQDHLRVGDWDGDGLATVALLRPQSGELWLFPAWEPDAAVSARFAGRFPDSDGLLRRARPDRDLLLVHHPDGTTTEIPVA